MTRLAGLLLMASVLMVCVFAQTLPAAGPGDYVIAPGDYNMTSNIVIDVNATSSIRANCALAGEVCVTIDSQGFAFLLSSLDPTTPLSIYGIRFTNTLASGLASLNLSSIIGPLSIENGSFDNSSTPFISGLPPVSLSLSYFNLTDNTASKIIDIFPTLDEFNFPIMESILLDHVSAENNLPAIPSINDSLISLQIQVVDLVTIVDSSFVNNANLLRIGESPTIVVSDGISHLIIRRSSFSNHPLISYTDINDGITTNSALFWQKTTSHGPYWLISENVFSNNQAPFVQVEYVDSILFEKNQFLDNPDSMIFDGSIEDGVVFRNNIFVRSGRIIVNTDPSFILTNATFTNDQFDFDVQGGADERFLQFFNLDAVTLRNVTFANIAPGNVSVAYPSVVYFEAIPSIMVDDCTFSNISFSDSSSSSIVHAGRLMVGYVDVTPITTVMTLKNNRFGEYEVEDEVTADIVAYAIQGRTGTLQLVSSPSSAVLNISRLATTAAVQIQSPVEIRDRMFNRANYGLGDVSLSNRLFVRSPLVVFGRMQLTLGTRVDFYWTPARNGSIQVQRVPTFVPRINHLSGTRLAVDLSNGLSVPKNSLYVLITQSKTVLPTQTDAIPIWSGKTNKPGFNGVLILTNSTTQGVDTYSEITMRATPICSIACVVGDCEHREFCTCDNGWAGTACTCLENGRPAGVQCSNSTTQFEWVASSPQTIASTSQLLVPAGLTYYVNSDMAVTGELLLTSTSKLVVAGQLSVSGSIIMDNEAEGYPFSCDFFTPTMITCGSLTTSSTGVLSVKANINNVQSCSSNKRDFTTDNFDSLIVVNSNAQLSGSLNVDATSVEVASGKQQKVKVLATNSSSSQIDLLAVNVETKKEVCPSTDKLPTLITVTFTICNGKKQKVQWWWYGAPVIAVGFILIVIVAISLIVPSYRRSIFPYSAK
jgi:hypothetical protein